MKPASIRTRVSLTIFAFSLLAALIVSSVGIYINEKIERAIWEQMLSSELEFQLSRASTSPDFTPNEKTALRTFSRALDSDFAGDVPRELLALPPGVHDELPFRGGELCVLVRDVKARRYYVTYDIRELEDLEHVLAFATAIALSAIGFLVLLFSLELGRWLVAPIHDLSERVASLDPDELHVSLAGRYHQQEAKTIAEAIDRFITRIRSFIRRERSFISMASHEFRTPLAAISGALDVLEAQGDLPDRTQNPLLRIRRSAAYMQEMISALLFLANEGRNREQFPCDECRLDEMLPALLDAHRYLLRGKDVALRLERTEPATITAPRALISVVLSNLIRNAVQYTPRGEVVVSLEDATLQVRDTGPGISKQQQEGGTQPGEEADSEPLAQGHGLGLYIVRRICERFDWQFTLRNNSGPGCTAAVMFKPAAGLLRPVRAAAG